MNHLTKLLELFPDKPWNYDSLSSNPNITWEFVQNNPDKRWDYDYLSHNPNLTWEIIAKNPDKPWNWDVLSDNKFDAECGCMNKDRIIKRTTTYKDELFDVVYHPDNVGRLLPLDSW